MKTLFSIIFFTIVSNLAILAQEDSSGSGGSGPDGSACICPENDSECLATTCPPIEPYVPTACELAMNDVWNAAQVNMDLLLKEPVCADYYNNYYGDGADEDVSTAGVPELEFNGSKGKLIMVKKRSLRRLRRRAARCE